MDQLLQWWAKSFVDVAKINYQIIDPYHLSFDRNKRYVVMANHCSYYDIPLSVLAIKGSIRMITKQSLFNVPIWGQGLRAAEFIPIDRKNHKKALQQLAVAKEKLASGIIIWLSPEGTRSKTGKLQAFKKGAFRLARNTNANIIPLYIKGANKIKRSGMRFNLNHKVTLYIGKPIDTSDYEDDNQSLISAVKNVLDGTDMNEHENGN